MRAVLVTGMSGVGKSAVLAALRVHGMDTVDTDEGDWMEVIADEQVWRLDNVTALLDRPRTRPLVVQGTVSNQGALYDRFDAIVLLTAPLEVMRERTRTRTSNDFGKAPEEWAKIERDTRDVEPLLRPGATHVIDTSVPLAEVIAAVERIALGL